MILHLLKFSHCPCCSTFELIDPTCHHAEEGPSMVRLVEGWLLASLVRGLNPQVLLLLILGWGLRLHIAHHRPLGPRFWEGTHHSKIPGADPGC